MTPLICNILTFLAVVVACYCMTRAVLPKEDT